MQLCEDGRLEGLTKLQAHLTGLTVPMGSPLAFTCAEGRRTILTVHQGPVWQGSCSGAPDLGEEGHISRAHCSPAPTTPSSGSDPGLSFPLTLLLYLQSSLREGCVASL